MNFGRMAKKVFSNDTVESIPVFKHLATQGANGVGMKNAYDVARQSGKKMSQASRMDSRLASKISKNEKEAAKIKADKGLGEADRERALATLSSRHKQLSGRKNGLSDTADGYQDQMVSGIGDTIKGVGRYFGATDMRGQSGRATAMAVRGGVAAAGYMGANTALRYVSGGGMTYNNTGERDIAGIPFL